MQNMRSTRLNGKIKVNLIAHNHTSEFMISINKSSNNAAHICARFNGSQSNNASLSTALTCLDGVFTAFLTIVFHCY